MKVFPIFKIRLQFFGLITPIWELVNNLHPSHHSKWFWLNYWTFFIVFIRFRIQCSYKQIGIKKFSQIVGNLKLVVMRNVFGLAIGVRAPQNQYIVILNLIFLPVFSKHLTCGEYNVNFQITKSVFLKNLPSLFLAFSIPSFFQFRWRWWQK